MPLRRPETQYEWALLTCWVLFFLGYGGVWIVELRSGTVDVRLFDAVMGVGTALLLTFATIDALRND